MIVWKSSDIKISQAEILRFLGYDLEKKAQINKRILKIIGQERDRAASLLFARGLYILSSAETFHGSELFSDADSLVFGLVTLGKDLEKEVQQMFKNGEGIRAMVLDAIGSVAVEDAADQLNQVINNQAKKQYPFATRRFSPGYGCWDVSGQQLLFDQFDGAEEVLGVRLSSSMLMTPLKSVSFVVKLGQKALKEINEESCDCCQLKLSCLERKGGQLCSIATRPEGHL